MSVFITDSDDVAEGDKITSDGLKICEVVEKGYEKRGREGVLVNGIDDDPDDARLVTDRELAAYWDKALVAEMKKHTEGESVEPP